MKTYKIFTLFISIICFMSCINDLAFYHDSSKESEVNNLLIARYYPNTTIIAINGKNYSIIDSWTAYKFKNRKSKELYKDIFAFTFVLEDSSKNRIPKFDNVKYIKCLNAKALYKGVGIHDSQYRLFFDNQSLSMLDTIKLEFQSGNNLQRVNFVKQP